MRPSAPGRSETATPILSGEPAETWVRDQRQRRRTVEGGPTVRGWIEEVRGRGDAALREFTERWDGVRPPALRVPRELWFDALKRLSSARRSALEHAIRNIRLFHARQSTEDTSLEVEPGVVATRTFRPFGRVGLYVPGGRAAYPSTLLMTAVPARLAGCREVVACSPPGRAGLPADAVLAAAALLDIDELYAVGGVQAIAALAYGTETIRPVEKIFGPGSALVTAAKRAVSSDVPVDLTAGPSEVLVWTDEKTPPAWIAAELIAQAEHGADAFCAAILPSEEQAAAVRAALDREMRRLPPDTPAAESLRSSALLLASGVEQALRWIEDLAPEHLALMRVDADLFVDRIRSAGSVLLGPNTPVAAGDYVAGPNHVLPTGGEARIRGALGIEDFGRWMQTLRILPEGWARLAPTIETLADWEGLPAHARTVRLRRETGPVADAVSRLRTDSSDREPRNVRPIPLLRTHVAQLPLYAPDRATVAAGVLLDANENGFGPLVPEFASDLHRYPDPAGRSLRAALARYLEVPHEAVWLGNGSDELIDLLLRACAGPGGTVVVAEPTYTLYATRACVEHASVRRVPLDQHFDLEVAAMRSAVRDARLTFVCSPNNPTGNLLSEERLLEVAESALGPVVVDEAYVEFADRPSLAPVAARGSNLVVLRTFSKAWGIAGARVGYLVAAPGFVRGLRRVALPYPLSTPAQRAACLALERYEAMRSRRERIVAERARMREEIDRLGLRVLPSEANFLLFFVPDPAAVRRRLLTEFGVAVRDRSMLARLQGALRVTVGTPEENDRFLHGLATILEAEGISLPGSAPYRAGP